MGSWVGKSYIGSQYLEKIPDRKEQGVVWSTTANSRVTCTFTVAIATYSNNKTTFFMVVFSFSLSFFPVLKTFSVTAFVFLFFKKV